MTQALYILFAISAGLGSALQTALLGSLGRERGAWEASFISALASAGGLAFVLGARSVKASACFTRATVGGTTGRPSLQPRRRNSS